MPVEKKEGKREGEPYADEAQLLDRRREDGVEHLMFRIWHIIKVLITFCQSELLYLKSEHYSENCTEAAEYDGVPLEFDLHPENGEGGRGHTAGLCGVDV